jgi:hypothetical protein
VSAHFEKANREPGFYRGLFLELSTERRSLDVQLPSMSLDQNAEQCEESALKSPTLGEFLMVMDVFLGGECILSCSAGAEALSCAEREVEPGLIPPSDLEEFKWSTFSSSGASQAASEASLDTFAAGGPCTELTESMTLPQLSMTWRLLRKSDMRLLTLLKVTPILVIRRSYCAVESSFMLAFGDSGHLLKGPGKMAAMKLSKVGAWRTHRFSRWLHLQGQKVTVDQCFN